MQMKANFKVGMAGFEPATSWSQTRRDTGLRYIPNKLISEGIQSSLRREWDSNPRYSVTRTTI